jgi:transcriptional regulator GlxA family with amidase domain
MSRQRYDRRMASRKRRVVLFAFDGMQLLNLVGPSDIFDAATRVLGDGRGYDVTVATIDGGPVRGSSGLRVAADAALGRIQPSRVDTLIAGGGMNVEPIIGDPRLSPGLQRISISARRTCSVCTGAFLLADAGLLERRAATTHWAFAAELQRRHPAVDVSPDRIFVRDGHVTTSAGATAGMDLALALVQEDHGPEVARTVARWTVMFMQRPGGQSQFSTRLALPAGLTPPIREILDSIVADPAADHSLAALASRASFSERHMRRVFAQQTNTTPARFVELVRVEAAREQLEQGAGSIDAIASSCGFGSGETMRRAFLRVVGVGPADYRSRFRSTASGDLAA